LAYARKSTTVSHVHADSIPIETSTLLYAETTIAEVKAVERRAAQWTAINDKETISGKREKKEPHDQRNCKVRHQR
jgi:hypothetical protein